MPKRKKIDRSHLVKASANATQKVVTVNQECIDKQLGVAQGINETTGQPFLKIRCVASDAFDKTHEVNLSYLLSITELVKPFLQAFQDICNGMTIQTINSRAIRLSIFWRFLEEEDIQKLLDIDSTLINKYKKYLDNLKSSLNKENYLADATKAGYLSVVREIFDYLKKSPEYQHLISPKLVIALNQWPGWTKKINPTHPIDFQLLVQIQKACLEEINQILVKYQTGQELIQKNWDKVPGHPTCSSDYKELGILLASIEKDFGGFLPQLDKVRRKNKYICERINRFHNRDELREYFHATSRTLVPFVIMLACSTFYNSTTLLELKLSDIKESWFFGDSRIELDPNQARIVISAGKRRSRNTQTRSFSAHSKDPFQPAYLIEQVKCLTTRLRPHLSPEFYDWLFVYKVKRMGIDEPRGFDSQEWKKALSRFIKAHGLPHFSLNQFRVTGSGIVHLMTGGDIKAQQTVLNHLQASTTYKRYNPETAKQRNDERIANIQNKQVRWVETKGKCDTRGAVNGAGVLPSTQNAATPGFECLDAFNSPRHGQKKGKLCTAFGECGDCPNAAVNPSDVYALARLLQYEEHLTSATKNIALERYVHLYLPQLKALRSHWLLSYTNLAVWQQAKELLSLLPPFPPLE
jgi:hypothetical protein